MRHKRRAGLRSERTEEDTAEMTTGATGAGRGAGREAEEADVSSVLQCASNEPATDPRQARWHRRIGPRLLLASKPRSVGHEIRAISAVPVRDEYLETHRGSGNIPCDEFGHRLALDLGGDIHWSQDGLQGSLGRVDGRFLRCKSRHDDGGDAVVDEGLARRDGVLCGNLGLDKDGERSWG